jgi:excisionase family DNA binding protein
MDDRWLSISWFAQQLRIGEDTVQAWIADKELPGPNGWFWKFKRSEVDGSDRQ